MFFTFCRLISDMRSLGRSSPDFARCSMVTQIYKTRSEVLGALCPAWNLATQKDEISVKFPTTLRLDRKYLRNATRHRQSENGIANYGHSRTGKLNLLYFGLQMAKNRTRVLTLPLAIVQRTADNKSVASLWKRLDRFALNFQGRCGVTMGRPD